MHKTTRVKVLHIFPENHTKIAQQQILWNITNSLNLKTLYIEGIHPNISQKKILRYTKLRQEQYGLVQQAIDSLGNRDQIRADIKKLSSEMYRLEKESANYTKICTMISQVKEALCIISNHNQHNKDIINELLQHNATYTDELLSWLIAFSTAEIMYPVVANLASQECRIQGWDHRQDNRVAGKQSNSYIPNSPHAQYDSKFLYKVLDTKALTPGNHAVILGTNHLWYWFMNNPHYSIPYDATIVIYATQDALDIKCDTQKTLHKLIEIQQQRNPNQVQLQIIRSRQSHSAAGVHTKHTINESIIAADSSYCGTKHRDIPTTHVIAAVGAIAVLVGGIVFGVVMTSK